MMDPIPLAQDLMRRRSVTPADDGALDVLSAALEGLGFHTRRMKFGEVDNLYAKRGGEGRTFCFAGHTDVVPIGDGSAWTRDPFGATLADGWLIGRGAADMKAAIAAMVAGVDGFLGAQDQKPGAISFLITGDEEGPGVNGTPAMLRALAAEGERIDHCLVGEPTSVDQVGDIIKNGRRGSLNAILTAEGRQGHVAYPDLAANPITALIALLAALRARRLDDGAEGFDPSNLEVTTVDVGNPTHNVIPARAAARLNIRFNTRHSGDDLKAWIEREAEAFSTAHGVRIEAAVTITGRPFLTPAGAFTDLVRGAVRDTAGTAAQLSTSGGTSDARFIKDVCPVVELGLQNATAHMVDERVRVDDVRTLARCYEAILVRYFAA